MLGYEYSGASCSPSPDASRQAKRRSPPATRCSRAEPQPKSLRICVPYQESKGVSGVASSATTRAAPIRGYQLPGGRPPPLPRKASTQATRTWPRCPVVTSIPRTPHSENLKAPAKIAVRAPPDPQGHPRPTATSYHHRRYHLLSSAVSLVQCVRFFRAWRPRYPRTCLLLRLSEGYN